MVDVGVIPVVECFLFATHFVDYIQLPRGQTLDNIAVKERVERFSADARACGNGCRWTPIHSNACPYVPLPSFLAVVACSLDDTFKTADALLCMHEVTTRKPELSFGSPATCAPARQSHVRAACAGGRPPARQEVPPPTTQPG